MAETAYIFPDAAVNEALAGSTNSWTDPGNITADDGSNASVGTLTSSEYSDRVKCTFDFSSVPNGAAILGIEAVIEHEANDPNYQDHDVILRKDDGGAESNDKSSGTKYTSGAPEAYTYGGSSDLWGYSEITRSELDTLQVLYAIEANGSNGDPCEADYVKIKVFYSAFETMSTMIIG